MMFNPLMLRYGLAALTILFYTFVVYSHGAESGRNEIQAKWNIEKNELAANYQALVDSSRLKEKIQNEITSKIQTSYNRDVGVLSARLRDYSSTCAVTVSSSTESTAGTGTATTDTIAYRQADAINDLLQCSKLIEWVKATY